MSEERPARHILARITGHPAARAHAVIVNRGVHACSELPVLATDAQLSAVLDLDLWTTEPGSSEEQFDPARFREWLEMLVDTRPMMAAERLARMDTCGESPRNGPLILHRIGLFPDVPEHEAITDVPLPLA